METVSTHNAGTPPKSFAYVALFSAGLHAILVILKYSLGIYSGSIALKADAFHSLADLLSSLGIFVGIIISERKSKLFPYGLYKAENLTALLTSFFIFYAAYEIIKEVFHSDQAGSISNVPIAVLGLVLIAGLAYAFSRYEGRVGRKVGSPSLVADAAHIHTDILSTAGIAGGLLASLAGWHIDRYLAVIIAGMILILGVKILVDSIKVLLDASVSREMLDQIEIVFQGFPQVMRIERLSGRNSGRYKFLEAEITLDVEALEEAHQICSSIEEEVYDCFPEVDNLLIHYEPVSIQKTI